MVSGAEKRKQGRGWYLQPVPTTGNGLEFGKGFMTGQSIWYGFHSRRYDITYLAGMKLITWHQWIPLPYKL